MKLEDTSLPNISYGKKTREIFRETKWNLKGCRSQKILLGRPYGKWKWIFKFYTI